MRANGEWRSDGANARDGDGHEGAGVDGNGGDGDVAENDSAGRGGGGGEQDEPFYELPTSPMSRVSMAAGRRGMQDERSLPQRAFHRPSLLLSLSISSDRARGELSIAPFQLKFA